MKLLIFIIVVIKICYCMEYMNITENMVLYQCGDVHNGGWVFTCEDIEFKIFTSIYNNNDTQPNYFTFNRKLESGNGWGNYCAHDFISIYLNNNTPMYVNINNMGNYIIMNNTVSASNMLGNPSLGCTRELYANVILQ